MTNNQYPGHPGNYALRCLKEIDLMGKGYPDSIFDQVVKMLMYGFENNIAPDEMNAWLKRLLDNELNKHE